MLVQALVWEDPLKDSAAIHSNILAWETPQTEEPGRPQSMGLQSDTTQQLMVQACTVSDGLTHMSGKCG